MAQKSYAATYFIHRSFEDEGCWHDTGMRFATEREADYMALRILTRIYAAMPDLYRQPDLQNDIFAGLVGDPVNCEVHPELMDQIPASEPRVFPVHHDRGGELPPSEGAKDTHPCPRSNQAPASPSISIPMRTR